MGIVIRGRIKMSDPINRQAAIDIFDDYNISVENGELEAYSRDRKRLCDLPSVQPEIIRCKDCRWNDGVAYCEMHFRDVKGDDFCSGAERRTNE